MTGAPAANQRGMGKYMGVLDDLHKAHKERQKRLAEAAKKHINDKVNAAKSAYQARWDQIIKAKLAEADADRKEREKHAEESAKMPKFGRVSAQKIILACSRHLQITTIDICGQGRSPEKIHARHIAMYLVCKMTGASYPVVGRHFGGKDHTTVMHAKKKIEARIAAGDPIANDVDAIMMLIDKMVRNEQQIMLTRRRDIALGQYAHNKTRSEHAGTPC